MGKKKKQKKEKVVYYDDNSTISDMSNVTRIGRKSPPPPRQQSKPRSTFKEKWKTYWSAVKTMVLPMLIALFIIGLLYVLLMWISGNFA